MIDYLHIKGYKSIKDVRVDFRPINILIGANGSGKSNLLSFFSFFDQLKKYHFHDTSRDKSPFREWSHVLNDVHFLYEKGSNLAAILYMIQQEAPKTYMRIVKTIQSIAPLIDKSK